MRSALEHFDKAFENRIRLQIMSILVANENYDFNSLKELLEVTDGNLASHLKALEKEEYIIIYKSFLGRKPKYQLCCLRKRKNCISQTPASP